jgi:hypothetical protein
LGRLDFAGGKYRFAYSKGARVAEGFQYFHGMEDLGMLYESEELFPVFANRLLSKNRPEYDAYLTWGGFDPNNPPDPISILGVTEGIRRTDPIEVFPCPEKDEEGMFRAKFFLHGLHHMPEVVKDRVNSIKPGTRLYPMLDFCNPVDKRAVALRTEEDGVLVLGYAPRYLARDMWQIFEKCSRDKIQFEVVRANPNAPFQQRLLCKMRSCWPEGFAPCSGEEFQLIPDMSGDLVTA